MLQNTTGTHAQYIYIRQYKFSHLKFMFVCHSKPIFTLLLFRSMLLSFGSATTVYCRECCCKVHVYMKTNENIIVFTCSVCFDCCCRHILFSFAFFASKIRNVTIQFQGWSSIYWFMYLVCHAHTYYIVHSARAHDFNWMIATKKKQQFFFFLTLVLRHVETFKIYTTVKIHTTFLVTASGIVMIPEIHVHRTCVI